MGRRTNMKRSIAYCMITASAISVEGLITKAAPAFAKRTPRRTQSSSLQMYLDGFDDALLSSSILTSTAAPISTSNLFTSTSQHIASDPRLEAEILTDVSHVALDFSTFYSPNTAWIRFCNLFGRILIITSDYVQDHYISPDEAFFQAAMLAISTNMFWRSAWPVVSALGKTSLSVRDRRAFSRLFTEVDLTVLQFKTLLNSGTLDWVELKDGEQVDLNGEYLYWLYNGEISSSLHDSIMNIDDASSSMIGHRMFGEVHLAKALEESRLTHKAKSSKSSKVKAVDDSSSIANETLTASSNGAVLLRMSTSKLMKLMHHDDELYDSMNGLMLSCMQEKLTRTLYKTSGPTSNATSPSRASSEMVSV